MPVVEAVQKPVVAVLPSTEPITKNVFKQWVVPQVFLLDDGTEQLVIHGSFKTKKAAVAYQETLPHAPKYDTFVNYNADGVYESYEVHFGFAFSGGA